MWFIPLLPPSLYSNVTFSVRAFPLDALSQMSTSHVSLAHIYISYPHLRLYFFFLILFILWCAKIYTLGYSDSSVGKESTCNAGDPSSIPGSGRSLGEGAGYPLQYSWASLVAQLVKHLPAMRETWVQSLGWEDPLEKGKATHSSILAWRIPWTIWSMGSQRVRNDRTTFTFNLYLYFIVHGPH